MRTFYRKYKAIYFVIKSVLKSSAYSGIASILSYGLTILLARNESQIAFAEYTYSITWGLILVQLIEFATVQCLIHFSLRENTCIERATSFVHTIKYVIFFVILFTMVLLEISTGYDVPFKSLFFIIPAFYFTPIFEFKSKNVQLAKILFFEKAIYLLTCFIYLKFFPLNLGLYIIYFVISLISVGYQIIYLNLNVKKIHAFRIKQLIKYCCSYWTIYLTLISQMAYGHLSRILIEYKLGLIVFASISVVLQMINAVSIVQTQVDRHVRPLVIGYVHDVNVGEINKILLIYLLGYVVPLGFGAALIYTYSYEIITLIFGEKWYTAGLYLRYLIPMFVLIAMLRLLDIFVVAISAGTENLLVNLFVAILLSVILYSISSDRPVQYFLVAIVCVQAFHVTLVAIIASIKIKKLARHVRA